MIKFLYVYKWATFGGVERVILSRAEAFKMLNVSCRIYMYYLEDGGALQKFKDYVNSRGLDEYIQIVNDISEFDYDYVVSIDTPEILNLNVKKDKVLIECHTSYIENQKYLDTIPDEVAYVIVPSHQFKNDVLINHPHLRNKLLVVRNYVQNDNTIYSKNIFDSWNMRPLVYLGRFDELKNYKEVFDIFKCYRDVYGDELILVLIGPCLATIDLIGEIERRCILDRTVILPPVTFEKTGFILDMLRKKEGIFISASLAESYGLSVAEAICAGLPVLLSGISGHAALVNNDSRFLYPLGNVSDAVFKLRSIVENYENTCASLNKYQQQFTIDTFIADWNDLLMRLT